MKTMATVAIGYLLVFGQLVKADDVDEFRLFIESAKPLAMSQIPTFQSQSAILEKKIYPVTFGLIEAPSDTIVGPLPIELQFVPPLTQILGADLQNMRYGKSDSGWQNAAAEEVDKLINEARVIFRRGRNDRETADKCKAILDQIPKVYDRHFKRSNLKEARSVNVASYIKVSIDASPKEGQIRFMPTFQWAYHEYMRQKQKAATPPPWVVIPRTS